jgi:hypothetical protein
MTQKPQTESDKFERTVRRLLAMPPKPREEMKIGKIRAKPKRSPKRTGAKAKR